MPAETLVARIIGVVDHQGQGSGLAGDAAAHHQGRAKIAQRAGKSQSDACN